MKPTKFSFLRATLALAVPLTGCLTLQALPLETVEPGQQVRVRLAAPRDVDIGTVTVRDVIVVEGSILETSDGGATILTRWVESEAGSRHPSLGDRVRVDASELAAIEAERVEGGKTALAVVGSAALFAGAMFAIFNTDTQATGDQGDGGDSPPTFTLKLLWIPLLFH